MWRADVAKHDASLRIIDLWAGGDIDTSVLPK